MLLVILVDDNTLLEKKRKELSCLAASLYK